MVVILVKNIEFNNCGRSVVISKGTEIFVDLEEMVGYHDGDHFDIFDDEFSQLH